MNDKSSRRGRRSAERKARQTAGVSQKPFKQITYGYRPQEIISADHIGHIHETALCILEEVGMKVLAPSARDKYAAAGFSVDHSNELVKFDRQGLEELVAKAPDNFELTARNPSHNIKFGGRHAVFTSVGGPAYVSDLDKGRRDGTYAEVCDFLNLSRA